MELDKAKADDTPFPPPDISSPKSSFANLSFIKSTSESGDYKVIIKYQNTFEACGVLSWPSKLPIKVPTVHLIVSHD